MRHWWVWPSLLEPDGFTLIELMIVILIIAILVAIAVPVYLNSRSNAQRRTCQSNQRIVDGAVMNYQANAPNEAYPTALTDLTLAGAQVLKAIPTCPVNGPYTWVTAPGNSGTPPYITCTVHPRTE